MSKAAPKGNKFATKLKEPAVRQEAYRQYCNWIANGWSKEAFVFDHPIHSVCHKTMERYIKENPTEFPIIHKEKAEAKSYEHWEKLGKQMMLGEIKGAQPAIYQMFMRNKFGWDKEEKISPEAPKEFDQHLEMIKPSVKSQ